MKYKNGDKFIIEIESRINSEGLYKIKGYNTLVFDDNGLDRLEQVHEHDGCKGCKYEDKSSVEYPCASCKNVHLCRWEPKGEEIQVGDEVENKHIKLKGVVHSIDNELLYILRSGAEHTLTGTWSKESCIRTGKTYPELIKALEQLSQGQNNE